MPSGRVTCTRAQQDHRFMLLPMFCSANFKHGSFVSAACLMHPSLYLPPPRYSLAPLSTRTFGISLRYHTASSCPRNASRRRRRAATTASQGIGNGNGNGNNYKGIRTRGPDDLFFYKFSCSFQYYVLGGLLSSLAT